MNKLTSNILKLFVADYKNIKDPSVRSQYGSLEGWISIVVNVCLFILKLTVGITLGSVALVADAIHTLSDSFTSLIVIFGFKISQKPSDKEHPFGHGRMEAVSALIISVILFIVGVEFLQKSIYRIFEPRASSASLIVIIIIVATIIVKELLARFAFDLADTVESHALKADGYHHRCDAITTIFVLLALIASRYEMFYFDGIMGIFVSLAIMYSGFLAGKEAIDPLLGAAVSRETLIEIERLALTQVGVSGVHDIIYQNYGQTSIISLHIEVSDKENANTLHSISESVEEVISAVFGGVVVAHIDPINKDHPLYNDIFQTISEIVSKDVRVKCFHELRIVGAGQNKCNVVFDIALNDDIIDSQSDGIIIFIDKKFRSKFPEMRTVIKVEPKFVYNI